MLSIIQAIFINLKTVCIDIIKDKKIEKQLAMMPDCSLKSIQLYKLVPFSVVNLSTTINLKYTSFDFSSKEFELRHRTSIESAFSIIKTKLMYGQDGNQAAHFEHVKGSRNCAAREGVYMYFKWNGEQKNVKCTHIHEEKPNILFHVSAFDYSFIDEKTGNGYWESRIYPETLNGLSLIGLSSYEDSHSMILFDKPVNISIITKRQTFNMKIQVENEFQ
ncbi:hypothetical protein [Sulfurimonas sp.]